MNLDAAISNCKKPTLGTAMVVFIVAEILGIGLQFTLYKGFGILPVVPLLTSSSYLLVAAFFLFRIRQIPCSVIGIQSGLRRRNLAAWLFVGILFGFLLSWLRSSYDNTISKAGATSIIEFLLLLNMIVVSPMAEELFFRGILFTSLVAKVGSWLAILLVSAIESLYHLPYFYQKGVFSLVPCVTVTLPIFCLSLLFMRKRSIVGNIFIHSGINLGMAVAERFVI